VHSAVGEPLRARWVPPVGPVDGSLALLHALSEAVSDLEPPFGLAGIEPAHVMAVGAIVPEGHLSGIEAQLSRYMVEDQGLAVCVGILFTSRRNVGALVGQHHQQLPVDVGNPGVLAPTLN
jgi:hypothetical protein